MQRRAFILAGIAVTLATVSPLTAQQVAAQPNVGILNYATDDDIRVRQFLDALRAVGYVEGRSSR